MKRAIMREPTGGLEACEISFLERLPVDPNGLRSELSGYREALQSQGIEVQLLPPLEGYPDSIYVEDTAVVLDGAAVIARPGALSREGEVPSVKSVLALTHECLEIESPGTLEGGDVCVDGRVIYVGQTRRTNHPGLKQMAHLVLNYGYMVKAVEVHGCLHLKSALSSLGDGRLLINPEWIETTRVSADEFIEVHPSEPFGANVLALGEVLLCSSSYPRTNEILRSRGFEVLEIDLFEVHKMEAAVTCPSLLLDV